MTENEILQLIKTRVAAEAASSARPTASASDIASAERSVGFSFPHFYRRLLSEVANGGFGPGLGMIGIPPDGFEDSDLEASLTDAYLRRRDPAAGAYRLPEGLLFLCNWGCGSFSYIDCLDGSSRVITHESLEDGLEYTQTASSLAAWLADWASGIDVRKSMHAVTGYLDLINPFTRESVKVPVLRMTGTRLDLSDRI